MKSAFLIAALLFIASCTQLEWRKFGASPAQQTRDEQECVYEADKATAAMSGNELAVAFRRQDLIDQCLQLRGYRHIRVN